MDCSTLSAGDHRNDEIFTMQVASEALPQTNESWLVLNSLGRAPLVPVW